MGRACNSVIRGNRLRDAVPPDASYFARRTVVESKAQATCISTNEERYDSQFQIFIAATRALPSRSQIHRCTCFQRRVCHYQKRTAGQTRFCVGGVCNMMSVPEEGAERLLEIFREMLALSETSRSNHSQSAVPDNSMESFDTHDASGSAKVCAAQRKHPSDESQECEGRESQRQ